MNITKRVVIATAVAVAVVVSAGIAATVYIFIFKDNRRDTTVPVKPQATSQISQATSQISQDTSTISPCQLSRTPSQISQDNEQIIKNYKRIQREEKRERNERERKELQKKEEQKKKEMELQAQIQLKKLEEKQEQIRRQQQLEKQMEEQRRMQEEARREQEYADFKILTQKVRSNELENSIIPEIKFEDNSILIEINDYYQQIDLKKKIEQVLRMNNFDTFINLRLSVSVETESFYTDIINPRLILRYVHEVNGMVGAGFDLVSSDDYKENGRKIIGDFIVAVGWDTAKFGYSWRGTYGKSKADSDKIMSMNYNGYIHTKLKYNADTSIPVIDYVFKK